MYIAHRGLVSGTVKENTLEAFNLALESSRYIGIELDVRVSKDNEFIVYHDLLFKGRLVKNVLYNELKKEGVSKLIDVLKLDTNKILMIEIKDFDIDLKKLAKLLKSYNTKNLYISSFNNKILLNLRKNLKNVKIGSLNYVLNSKEDYSAFDFIGIINYLLTDELIKYFRKRNIEVFGYGVSSIQKIKYKNINYIVDEKIFK